jgi:hypothetical protein
MVDLNVVYQRKIAVENDCRNKSIFHSGAEMISVIMLAYPIKGNSLEMQTETRTDLFGSLLRFEKSPKLQIEEAVQVLFKFLSRFIILIASGFSNLAGG